MNTRQVKRIGLAAQAAFALALASVSARAQTAPPPEPSPYPATSAPSPEPAAPAPEAAAPSASADSSTAAPAEAKTDTAADAAADAAAAAAAAEATASPTSADTGDGFKLNLYGFADFTYNKAFDMPLSLAIPPTSFAVGKLNLYAAAELGDNWRSLAEIRFMYLPDGNTTTSNLLVSTPRTDTTVGDYTDLDRPVVKWGGISIERAWLEHTFDPALTLRIGSWLTPYGIWNVDHGSPAIIGVRRPYIIGEALFPERQTGIEAYGALNFGPSQFGYHLTLSNGRGPIDSYKDLDNNKALGARLYFKHESPFGVVTVGASGYRGKYTDSNTIFGLNEKGELAVTVPVKSRYDELSLAADVKWEYAGVLVQSEVAMNEVAYVDKYRPAVVTAPGFVPDHRRLGGYVLAGYRTPFFGIMPFGGGEYYTRGEYVLQPPAHAVFGGINARPTARVVLKAQFTHAWFGDWNGPDLGYYTGLDLQAAWSF